MNTDFNFDPSWADVLRDNSLLDTYMDRFYEIAWYYRPIEIRGENGVRLFHKHLARDMELMAREGLSPEEIPEPGPDTLVKLHYM